MSRKRNGSGLFNGWWTDLQGRRLERIKRDEYPDLYRLHRVCQDYERLDAGGTGTTTTAAIPKTAPKVRPGGPRAVPSRERPGMGEANPFH